MIRTQPTATPTAAAESDLSRFDCARIHRNLLTLRAELRASENARSRLQLTQVDAALRKLESGRYGLCEACSKPVVKARLLAMPHLRYCITCSG